MNFVTKHTGILGVFWTPKIVILATHQFPVCIGRFLGSQIVHNLANSCFYTGKSIANCAQFAKLALCEFCGDFSTFFKFGEFVCQSGTPNPQRRYFRTPHTKGPVGAPDGVRKGVWVHPREDVGHVATPRPPMMCEKITRKRRPAVGCARRAASLPRTPGGGPRGKKIRPGDDGRPSCRRWEAATWKGGLKSVIGSAARRPCNSCLRQASAPGMPEKSQENRGSESRVAEDFDRLIFFFLHFFGSFSTFHLGQENFMNFQDPPFSCEKRGFL